MLAIQGVQIARLERVSALSTESKGTVPVIGIEAWYFFASGSVVPCRASIDGETVDGAVAAEAWAAAPTSVRTGVLEAIERDRQRSARSVAAGPSSPCLWVRSRSNLEGINVEIALDLFNPQENAVKSRVFEVLSAGLLHDLRNQLTVLGNSSFALSSLKEGDIERAATCLDLGAKGISGAESLIKAAVEILADTEDETTTEALMADLVDIFRPRFQKFHQQLSLTRNTPGELHPDPWMLKLAMVVGVEFFRKQVSRGGTLEVSLEAMGTELQLGWHVLEAQESVNSPEAEYRKVGLNAMSTEGTNLWRVQVPLVVEEVFDER